MFIFLRGMFSHFFPFFLFPSLPRSSGWLNEWIGRHSDIEIMAQRRQGNKEEGKKGRRNLNIPNQKLKIPGTKATKRRKKKQPIQQKSSKNPKKTKKNPQKEKKEMECFSQNYFLGGVYKQKLLLPPPFSFLFFPPSKHII